MEIIDYLNQCLIQLEHVQNYSQMTIASMRNTITLFIKITKAKDLRDLTKNRIKDWFMEGGLTQNWKTSIYIDYHKYFGIFLSWLVKRGKIERNFIKEIDLPRLERSISKGLIFYHAEILIQTCRRMRYKYQFEQIRNYTILNTLLFLREWEKVRLLIFIMMM